MKKIVMVVMAAALLMGIGIQNASADNGLKQGTFGFGVDTSTDLFIHGKYLVLNDLAILGGFGLGIKGSDDKGTDVAIGAGVRKYLKVADFAPFVGGFITYASNQDANVKDLQVAAEAGAEYFLSKHFSFEGAVQVGFKSNEVKSIDNAGLSFTTKRTDFGTTRSAIGFNFYF